MATGMGWGGSETDTPEGAGLGWEDTVLEKPRRGGDRTHRLRLHRRRQVTRCSYKKIQMRDISD